MDYKSSPTSVVKSQRNSCNVCLRYFIIICTILLLVIGICMTSLMLYVELVHVYYTSTVLKTPLASVSDYLLVIAGIILLITTVIGFIATVNRQLTTTAAYISLLVVVLLTILAGIVSALVFRMLLNEDITQDMQQSLLTEYGVDVNNSKSNRHVTNHWDIAQSTWECCAIEEQGWSIYQQSKWYQLQPGTPNGEGDNAKPYVPKSCCVTDETGYISDADLRKCQTTSDGPPARLSGSQYTGELNPTLHYRGCYQSARDYLLYDDLSWFYIVIGVGSVSSIILLFSILLTSAFYLSTRRLMRYVTSDSMQQSESMILR